MGMLDDNDKEWIGNKIGEELVKVFETTMMPVIEERLGTMLDDKIQPVKTELMDFVDRKVDGLKGEMVAGFKNIDSRFDEMTGVLKEKNVFTPSETDRLQSMRLYPKAPTA